jgi:hypothetical protein
MILSKKDQEYKNASCFDAIGIKLSILILTFLLVPSLIFSQGICTPTFGTPSQICATPDITDPDPQGVYSYNTDPTVLGNFEPVVFNIFYWGINKDDGTSTAPLTENLALASVAELNILFNQFNIFFKYYGIDYINSSRFYTLSKIPTDDCYVSNLWPFVADNNNQYKKTDAFNVYVAKGSNFGGVA